MRIDVSVIIPVYNAEKTIAKCIDSVLLQKELSLEIIIINDGSTDDTSKVLSKYKHHTNIKIIDQNNSGVSSARNHGLSVASGKYILFVDSDDYLESNLLMPMLEYAEQNSLDLLSCNHKEVNSTQYKGNRNASQSFIARNNQIGEKFWQLNPRSACAKLIKKSIIVDNNVMFDEKMSLGEDMIFIFEILSHCNSVGLLNGGNYIVQNVNSESLSKRYVEGLEDSLMKQYKAWSKLLCVYPSIQENYYSEHVDFRYYLMSLFLSNLYKQSSPYNFLETCTVISDKVTKYKRTISKKIDADKKPKNLHEYFFVYVIKSRNKYIIASFFYLKELIKKIKYRRM